MKKLLACTLPLLCLLGPNTVASSQLPEEMPAVIRHQMQLDRYICGWRLLNGWQLVPVYCAGSSGPVYTPPNPKP